MAELYLVRHGQASFGAANYDQLSARGEQQSEWLGEYFARHDVVFDRVVCGTLRRHEQTVEGILRGMGIVGATYEQHAGLNEYDFHGLFAALGDDFPELTRLATGSMRDHYRALKQVLHLWSEDKLRGPLPETWAAFQQRVADARAAIQGGGGQRVLAISSGGPIAVTAQQVLAAPAASAIALNLQIRNSSVSQYFFNADAFHLATFNSIPHLDTPERRDHQTYG
ncbi:hypothetical protein LMG7141_01619 [Ralstonia condita]|jgi:broad specificity phosphatase PhoE|uniref:Phosphoglycerate mutase n=3 Tax=Ralstonia TaxID=48736 RepID=C6BLD7_RALP1|nr:histidine phosphatase family protein [Ralstonia sp. LMG 7141]MDE2202176.1 histidine phosphatase family protein [Burkholderiaceae bacterium]CAJ0785252.1 hypothetical protein LMG7141_01619 [Ralstonia sp. LMG 7141]